MEDKKLQNSILDEIKIDNAQVMKANIKADYLEKKRCVKVPWYKNKIFYGIATPLLAASIAFAIVLPSLGSFNGSSHIDIIQNAKSSANIFAYQTVTSIGMLNSGSDMAKNMSLKTASLTTDELAVVETYLPVAENALKGESLLDKTLKVESDIPEYEVKLLIELDESETIVMYYNETLISDEAEEDESDAVESEESEVDDESEEETAIKKGQKLDLKDNNEEEETEFTISGIIQMEDITYNLSGSREIDPSDNELEIEIKYQIDKNNYVTVAQEIENDESSFEYVIVEGGHEKYEYSLSAEEDKVEIEVTDKGVEVQMEFEFQNDKEGTFIKVEYTTKDVETVLYYRKQDGEYIKIEKESK